MKSVKIALMVSSIIAISPALLFAQDSGQDSVLEEVVVTATKRASTIQAVPFSINAQTAEDIDRSGATNLEELSRNVAGLTIQNLGPGQSQVAIRGVSAGQIVRDQPGVKEQVGVYVDESVISLSLFTPDLDLFDLDRVETLRGPQGTLFGSGSVGGTIRFITNQPNVIEFEGSIEANLHTLADGEEGGHLKGVVNLPISDTFALRAVGYTTQYAGFIDALGEGGSKKSDVNSGERTGGRVSLNWQPNENLSITPRIIFQSIEADGFNRQENFNLYANPYTTTRPAIQLGDREQYLLLNEAFEDDTMIADLVVNWSLGSFDVTYAGSYIDRELLVSRDASALTGSVSVDLGYDDAGVLLPSNLRDTTDLQQVTHELRVSSNTAGSLQWVVGVYFSDMEREYAQRLPTPGYDVYTDLALGDGTAAATTVAGFPADSPYAADLPYDIEQTAIFGEFTYDVTDQLHLTLGGRWYDFEEQRDFISSGLFSNANREIADKTSSDGFNPRIMASYDVSDEVTLNAQASQGFRLGGVNDPLNATLCNAGDLVTFGSFQQYDDETMWNYEAGMKTHFGGVVFNAAVFYTDIEDLQVTLDAGSCSSRISFNVEEAHTFGVEFEFTVSPTDGLLLSLAGVLLEAEFDSTVLDDTGSILGGVEDGNRLASVPEIQLAAAGTYSFPIQMFGASEAYLTAVFQYTGNRYTQPSDQISGAGDFTSGLAFGGASGTDVTSLNLKLDAYNEVNLRSGIVWDTWEAILYVNNLTDENADLSFDRERGGRARLAFRTNQPRTIGMTLRKSF
ncbi:MAG: TonB-dependent receptor [bacterium]|nr:TonB-dependent receptor [Gammaproteobacteria bacterium]HIL94721.1 TonB-dependent receptor [Pseudomonadales bacterium]